MTQKKRKSAFGLKKTLKLGGGRKQTLLVLLGVIVALGASFGIYSQYHASQASGGCPYSYGNSVCVGENNSWGEEMFAWACQDGAFNGRNTVRAHYAVYHSRAGGHTYYGGIQNHDANLPSNYTYNWSWSSGTSVSGFQTLNASMGVNAYDNNYVGIYAGWGPYPAANGLAAIGSTLRPSGLPYCV
jgi:hypothetical protein